MVKTMTMAARVPHFHFVEDINCDALVELKESFQENNTDPTVKHTFLPTLIKSLSMALSKYPSINSCFNEESLELILKGFFPLFQTVYFGFILGHLFMIVGYYRFA